MGLTADDYRQQLATLLPAGPAWQLDDTAAGLQLDAWAEEFARVQARIDQLIDEADPRTTYELLTDFERVFGLPASCMAGIYQTLSQRRTALVTQMTTIGGQSRQYFIDLAAAAGFTITITEFQPFNVGMTVVDPILGANWAYAWRVNAPAETVVPFTVVSGVDEPLASWGNNLLECVINRFKPAHTVVIFSYA